MAFDREIAAMTAYMEASDQGPDGRRAVMHVLFNRVGRYGSNVADVCLKPFQFSSWNTTDPNRHRISVCSLDDPILADCLSAYDECFGGAVDPTLGATHYFADGIPTPSWAVAMTETVKIGAHNFYREP